MGDTDCNVTLRVLWRQSRTGTAPRLEEIHVPADGPCQGASLARNMSVALGQLSERILAAVAAAPAP
jgi:hypothetical protein